MLVVGLTGGIATGKSTVAAYFEQLGALRIDTDELARLVVEPGQPALAEIARRFGVEVIDEKGRLIRQKLAALVFKDEKKRKELESILHPRIREMLMLKLKEARNQGYEIALVEVPLLFETDFHRQVDCTVAVAAAEDIQLVRLKERNGLTTEEARLRIHAQMPLAEKIKRAHFVIDNSGTREETKQQVEKIWQLLKQEYKNDCKN
ncbi:MAG: dephospho-CoA kinase [Firmicutes bacterium]|mgnify:CR=1 FL=1|nr:dephospho-CoA kinase [Bacillota bacterium]